MPTAPLPPALPYERPSNVESTLPPAVRVGAIVYAVAVIVRHATYWSRAMLIGRRPDVAVLLALAEMATLVVLLTLVVGRRVRGGGIVACAIMLLVIRAGIFASDLSANRYQLSFDGALGLAWLAATHAQFCAIPAMLLVAGRARDVRVEA